MKVAAVVTVGLLALVAAAVASAEEGSQAHEGDHQREAEKDPPQAEADERLQSARREERIFAFFTTTSVKRLATTTITALSTCLSITNAPPPCTGRRKKSLYNSLRSLEDLSEPVSAQLLGSQGEDEVEEEPSASPSRIVREVVNNREGKRLTVWSTISSTLTLTSTSYVAGTTVTATALCAAPGLTAGCFGR